MAHLQNSHRFGRIEVLPAQRQVLVNGHPALLGARAFDLLQVLIAHSDRLLSKDELMALVWPGVVVEENNLSVQVSALRKLLGADAIATVPGRGYRLTLVADDAPVDVVASPDAVSRNLPAAPNLLGRTDDQRDLLHALSDHRIVTLLGGGGVGKTALALVAVHIAQADVRDGAVWVDLAHVSEPTLLQGVVGQAAQLALAGRDPLAALVRGLRGRQILLVLDNAEHLVDAVAALVAALGAALPELRLLITSQAPLHIQGERLFRLSGLAVPVVAVSAAQGMAYGAVALFAAQARALDRRFVLTDDSVALVVDICRSLDGCALAIKLAAARLPLLGLATLHARLNERFRMLGDVERDAPDRHRTLRAALDWSYQLLSVAEQAVFRRLGALVGSFSLELAAKSAADEAHDEWATIDMLGTLVERSLVAMDGDDPPRYRMLESAREFALMLIDVAGERAACHSRIADVLEMHFAGLTVTEPQVRAFHLEAAGRLAEAVPLWAHAAALAGARSALVEAAHHLEHALAALDSLASGAAAPAQRADTELAQLPLLFKLGTLHMLICGIGSAQAQADFERALAISDAHGARAERFIATFNLWFVSEAQIRFDVAGRYIEQTRQLAETSGDERFMVQAHHAASTTALLLGNYRQALEDSQAGYKRYRPADAAYHRENFVGHDPGICAIGHQAGALFMLGDPDAAYERVDRTLQAMDATTHEPSRVVGAYCLSLLLTMARDAHKLQPIVKQALATCQKLSLTQYVGLFTTLTAWADAATHQDPQAPGLALKGIDTFGSTGSKLRQPLLRVIAAETCLLCGQFETGLTTADQALQEITAHGDFGWHAYALTVRSGLHRAVGNLLLAEQDGLLALRVARSQYALGLELRAANLVASLWLQQGDQARACELLAPLLRHFNARRETRDLVEARALVGDWTPGSVPE